MKGKQSRGRPVPQRGRLFTPVQLDRMRSRRDKAVVAEVVVAEVEPVVAALESNSLSKE